MTKIIPANALKYFALPVILVAAGIGTYLSAGNLFKRESAAGDLPWLSTSALPAGGSVTATLETINGVSDFIAKDGTIEKPAQPASIPYRLSASVKLPKEQYRDFLFTVTEDKLSVVADGFHAGDLVFLDINGHNSFGRIPADWSGKLELTTLLPQEREINACVRIAGKTESFGLCHSLPERQVL